MAVVLQYLECKFQVSNNKKILIYRFSLQVSKNAIYLRFGLQFGLRNNSQISEKNPVSCIFVGGKKKLTTEKNHTIMRGHLDRQQQCFQRKQMFPNHEFSVFLQ